MPNRMGTSHRLTCGFRQVHVPSVLRVLVHSTRKLHPTMSPGTSLMAMKSSFLSHKSTCNLVFTHSAIRPCASAVGRAGGSGTEGGKARVDSACPPDLLA